MKSKAKGAICLILLFCLLLGACSPGKAAVESPSEKAIHVNTVYPIEEEHVILGDNNMDGYINNILVLFLKEGVTEKETLSWFSGEQATIAGRFPGIHQVQVRIQPRTKEELQSLANELMKKEEVLYAHVELAGSTVSSESSEETDPLRRNKPEKEWWYEAIGLTEAQHYLPKNDRLQVGVVDDGFDTQHKDLKLVFPNEEQEKLNQPEEHGTHVAGIVQQILPESPITVTDSYRIPGRDPHAHLITQCQFFKYFVDMVEKDVKVINYSMGGDITDDAEMPWNEELSSALSVYLWKLKQLNYDFIVVQSAGNAGIDSYRNTLFCTINEDNALGSIEARISLGVDHKLKEAQKSIFDSIVVVASTEMKDSAGTYYLLRDSNHGKGVTLAAPGIDINSTVPGGYQIQSGTSQAAPIVSGSLGLLWSLDKNLTSGQLKEILVSSATEYAKDSGKKEGDSRRESYPMLNLIEAVKKIQKS